MFVYAKSGWTDPESREVIHLLHEKEKLLNQLYDESKKLRGQH
jgi:hypothetical protein